MGYAPRYKGRQIVPWICQLLLAVHSPIFQSSPPIDRVDKKGCGLAMGAVSKGSIPPAEAKAM